MSGFKGLEIHPAVVSLIEADKRITLSEYAAFREALRRIPKSKLFELHSVMLYFKDMVKMEGNEENKDWEFFYFTVLLFLTAYEYYKMELDFRGRGRKTFH